MTARKTHAAWRRRARREERDSLARAYRWVLAFLGEELAKARTLREVEEVENKAVQAEAIGRAERLGAKAVARAAELRSLAATKAKEFERSAVRQPREQDEGNPR